MTPVDPLATAPAGVRRRRRLAAAIAGATAIIVLAPMAVVAMALGGRGPEVAADATSDGWRTESYNGVELSVPSTWGWGWTAFGCQPKAGGYVARPFPGTFSCADGRSSDASHVWFDSHAPVGSGEGQTTVRVRGTSEFTITVADPDPAKMKRIVDSIHPVATDSNGCPETPANIAWNSQDADPPNVTWASVCVYYAPDPTHLPALDATYLYYSTRVDRAVPELVRQINTAGTGPSVEPSDLCTSAAPAVVDLSVHSPDASTTYRLLPVVCPGQGIGYNAYPGFHVLTKESVALWAVDGVPAYARNCKAPTCLGHYLP